MSKQERRPGSDTVERGKSASFDPVSGEVYGSGSGAGANANPGEDYDARTVAGDGDDQGGGPKPRSRADQRSIDPDEGI
jgi:hypothetical protein